MVTVRPLVPEDYPVVKEIVAEAFGADLPPDTIRPFAKDLQRYEEEPWYDPSTCWWPRSTAR